MDWSKVLSKGFLGLVTFIVAYIASNPTVITGFVPEKYLEMTVGGAVAAALVALANWLKHKGK